MLIYFTVFALSCCLLKMAEKSKRKQRIFLVLFALCIPALLSGMRDYSMGYDVRLYGNRYFYMAQNEKIMSFMKEMTLQKQIEPLYALLTYISAVLFPTPHYMYFVQTFIILLLVYLAMADIAYSQNNGEGRYSIWVGMLAFYCFLFVDSFNVLRQHISVAVLLYGFRYIRRRNYFAFGFVVLVATGFHYTGILGLGLMLLYMYSDNKRTMQKNTNLKKYCIKLGRVLLIKIELKKFIKYAVLIVVCVYLVLGGGINNLLSLLVNLGILPGRYSTYSTNGDIIIKLSSLLSRIPVLIFLLIRNRDEKHYQNITFFIFISILEMIFVQMRTINLVFFRISYMFIEYKTLSMMIAYGNEKKNSKYCTLRCAIVIYLLLFFVLQFFILSSEGVYTSDVLKIY